MGIRVSGSEVCGACIRLVQGHCANDNVESHGQQNRK